MLFNSIFFEGRVVDTDHAQNEQQAVEAVYRRADSILVMDDGRLAELIEDFFSDKTAATQRAYRKDLKHFANFLDQESIQDASKHLLKHGQGAANWTALRYRKHLISLGLAPATINRRLASLRSLVDFAKHVGMIPWDISLKSVKHRKYRDTAGPGKETIQRMFTHVSQYPSPRRERDRAILGLMFFQGLRRAEVANLDLQDFDRNRNLLAVMGKGRSEKEFREIKGGLANVLLRWIEVRGDQPGRLIQSLYRNGGMKGGISENGVWHIVTETGRAVGVKVWPHAIRHTCITELCNTAMEAGLTLRDVMEFARHRNINTTMLYWDRTHSNHGKMASLLERSVNI